MIPSNMHKIIHTHTNINIERERERERVCVCMRAYVYNRQKKEKTDPLIRTLCQYFSLSYLQQCVQHIHCTCTLYIHNDSLTCLTK